MSFIEIYELLLNRDPLPSLVPRNIWDREQTFQIEALGQPPLVKAGLHLLNDDIEGCHQIAQNNTSSEGSYWHAILHRREPDYSNSKYWYRKVSNHPIYSKLQESYPEWEPFTFVDWCEDASRGRSKKSQEWLREVQVQEMKFLLIHSKEGVSSD